VAASDYSGDIAGDDKILARVVDTYRRIRNTLKFLLANTSDFDPATQSVALHDMLEIDRYALARAAQLQADILAHYKVFEFHPVVAKLQIYCSEDLGAFYLDILKDRLYTTGADSPARRSAQTALWQITQAMLRWMAPFLSFTAEEAWSVLSAAGKIAQDKRASIFTAQFVEWAPPDTALLDKWNAIRSVRDMANKEIEALREAGKVGSSLQARVDIEVPADSHADLLAALRSLGDDLRFVFITSGASVTAGNTLKTTPTPVSDPKCERCWHYRADVGHDAAHPGLCARCTSNLYGDGETRAAA
jgi:isoleucyl-tRNA synthetase